LSRRIFFPGRTTPSSFVGATRSSNTNLI